MVTLFILLLIFLLVSFAYHRFSLKLITLGSVLFLVVLTITAAWSLTATIITWILFALVLVPLNLPSFRQKKLSKPLFDYASKKLPTVSETEEQAIAAGTVNWDGEIFSGKPNWQIMLDYPSPQLSKEEQAFLDGPTEELCKMANSWEIDKKYFGVPDNILKFICDQRFFSFIISKDYGGLDYSAHACSDVLIKIGSRSTTLSSVITVPNSLGPGELISKYGTKQQKDYYLPRLANGTDIPCFALTGPFAGSDASALPDYGVVITKKINGKDIIGINLTFDKRYITLAPIATLIGLAFKLYDPEHLIGNQDSYGITCALIPAKTKGIDIGRRHLPLGQAFPNGPIRGNNVFVPIDNIIGGPKMAGQGWPMLVECLSVGRAISLPAGATSGVKVAARATFLYANIRRAFRLRIGQFEGVQEKLAEIAGFTFIIEALRLFTLAAIDRGEKPSVPSAIAKYHTTELGRMVSNHAMDIHAGKSIMLGPNNIIGHSHMGSQIGIIVEGTNVLTRNMIIFGQGSIRCHPHILDEMLAIKNNDLATFDQHIFSHIGFLLSNITRSFLTAITGAHIVIPPNSIKHNRYYFKQLTRFSSAFALVADVTMITMGGELKIKESLSARLGDILSLLYIGSAILKHDQDLGHPQAFRPLVKWSCQWLFYQIQCRFDELLTNYPSRGLSFVLRLLVFPLGKRFHLPNDELRHQVAQTFLENRDALDLLTQGIFTTSVDDNKLAQMAKTVDLLNNVSDIEKRVIKAQYKGKVNGHYFDESIKDAQKSKIISSDEAKQLLKAYQAMVDVLNVDDFSDEELNQLHK